MWFWSGLSNTIRECMNETKMFLDIFYILLKSIYYSSILFMVPIFLAPLYTSSYPVLQGSPHMVSFLGAVSCWAGLFLIVVSSMIPEVVI